MTQLTLSSLPKTWILDLDGTILKHNGYLTENGDEFIEKSKQFIENIPDNDYIIILTARKEKYKNQTISFLKKNKIRFNHIIFDIPPGERILINDEKPSGLKTAYATNLKRDFGIDVSINIDAKL